MKKKRFGRWRRRIGAACCCGADERATTIVTSFYLMYVLTLNAVTDGIDGVTVQNMAEQNVGCLPII